MKYYIVPLLFLILTCKVGNSQNDSILVDTLYRTYLVHLPTSYTPSKTYPLVVNMHGAGSNGAEQELYSFFNPIANAEEFIIVYPNGIYNVWNAGFTLNSDSLFDDVGFISNLIDSLASEYPIDLNRVYACGMSMGGFMSYRLACELEHKIAAIASVTGSMSDALINTCNPTRNVPIMEIHGTADSTVLYGGAPGIASTPDVINFWVQQHSCPEVPVIENLPDNANDGSNVIKHTYSPCDLSSEVLLYEVVNGGHTWPGALFSILPAGITNRDIKAQEEIWAFFSQHTLNNPSTALEALEKVKSSLEIYPNPATEMVTITSQITTAYRILIIDAIGNVRFQKNVAANTSRLEIPVASLAAGMYTITVRTKENSRSGKLVISR